MKQRHPLSRAAELRWSASLPALLLLASAPLTGGCGAIGAILDVGPGQHLERESILRVIAEETPVYYNDGKTRLGVFFDQEHRQYVRFDEVPKLCVDAIVAAEDQNYWDHAGIDPEGIARAFYLNIKAGGLVAGGSTITQQTAKNLYYRPDRSARSKWTEAVNALRLERRYTKQEILEFYFNQIHVSSNGRGIGIAARYFFDKKVQDLGLHECAFLGGFVKAPARYNPWLARSEEDKRVAEEKARHRTAYVLGRMKEMGSIQEQEYVALAGKPVPFKRGSFRYERSVILDAVEERLSRSPFPEILEQAGIENLASAGLSIVTTLDARAQLATTYGLWHHLTELGGYLEGATAASFKLPASMAPHSSPEQAIEFAQFLPAKVVRAQGSGRKAELLLDLGGPSCKVDGRGLSRVASIILRARKKNHGLEAKDADVGALLAALPAGTVVWASVREADARSAICDLELRPRLQGASVVLDHGEIRAMVGGNDNRNFNRVMDARRQFGSAWKPLLYNAAFQLGWLPTDVLDNRRAVFPFEGSLYYPQPDHTPESAVSVAWAGTRSENVASIWLLYHLTDRLNAEQVRRLAELLDLSQRSDESREDWVKRIRDEHGIIASQDRLDELAFEGAAEEVMADLAFSGHPEDAFELRSLLHGRGLERAAKPLLAKASAQERAQIRALLGRSFLELEDLSRSCREELLVLKKAIDEDTLPQAKAIAHLSFANGVFLCGESGTVGPGDILERLPEWSVAETPPSLEAENVKVGGVLFMSSLDALRSAMDRRKTGDLAGLDPWDPEALYRHPDFRRLLGMRYLARLARTFGVETDLPAGLSIPLGAADITLLEAAKIYQGFLEGATWRFNAKGQASMKSEASDNLILGIRTREGTMLYESERLKKAVADPVSARLTTDILRNVVLWGTGKRARQAVTLRTAIWPLYGKTGTTNGFKNVAFSGFAPVARGGSFRPEDSLTLSVYVGYDDNKPMSRGNLRVAGANGALPAWILAVQGMARLGVLGEPEGLPAGSGFVEEEGYSRVMVDSARGLPASPDSSLPQVLLYGVGRESRRRFVPFLESAEPVVDQPSTGVLPAPARAAAQDTGEDEPLGPASLWDEIDEEDEAEKQKLQVGASPEEVE